MPAGFDVTLPVPAPARVTVSGKFVDAILNVAVTLRAWLITTEQVPVALVHAPLQPANVEPPAGVAVSTTVVPLAMFAEQVVPQLMPPGFDVTVPVPVPILVIASANVDVAVKVAVTLRAAVMVVVQVPETLVHAPLQPANVEPAAGAAVSVTDVLLA